MPIWPDRRFLKSGHWHGPVVVSPPGDVTAPTISGITETNLTSSGVTISWFLDEPATGFVEYGLTTAYSDQTAIETTPLTFHSQAITGLAAATQYFYRIVSVDPAGNTGTSTGDFTTSGAAAAGNYGPRFHMSSKSNRRVAFGLGASYRFLAINTFTATRLKFSWRSQPGYGAGDGGIYEVGIQSDDGTANHYPSGTWLAAATTWDAPAGAAADGIVLTLTSVSITAGTIYHVVWHNTHGSASSNYGSLNMIFEFDQAGFATGTRVANWQPFDESGIYACLIANDGDGGGNPTAWARNNVHWPVFDLTTVTGLTTEAGVAHEGAPWVDNMRWNHAGPSKYVENTTNIIRAIFTPTSTVSVADIYILLARAVGTGSGNATLTLKVVGGATLGTATATGSGSADTWTVGADAQTGEFYGGTISGGPHTLTSGTQYAFEVSSPAGTRFYSVGMISRDSTTVSGEHNLANRFIEGTAQYSTNSGSTWTAYYSGFDNNFCWYAVLA